MIQSKELNRRHLILIVEDQEINRDVLSMLLEDDYDLVCAENGLEGLEIMRRMGDKLSLVLLDLMMPVMDGFEVLERMRDDRELTKLPVIVLTAEKSAELRALQLGAADFITKPFDMHEVILARVGRIIELSEGRNLINAAERDPLTGLYNRGFFFEYAEQIFRFHPEKHMDALVLNIERFHSLNELNGREFGDRVLRALGEEIHDFLTDHEGIASRIEADRFDIFCLPCEDYHAVLARFQQAVNTITGSVSIRLRMGVKPWHEDVTPSLMIDRARVACNMVRGSYKEHLMIFNEDMHEQELYNQRLLNDLRRALEEDQFVVFYQPKYNIQCEPPRLVSAEALIRWRHPELGMVSPGAFIPLFESNGLINLVDNFVWEKAAAQIALWREKLGLTLPVSVNLSRVEIFDPTLERTLLSLVKKNNITPHELNLEVTETAYTDNAQHLIEVIQHLRSKGFEIEMDDFGSGYSSLNMLSSLPIDVLKMDMKFIQNVRVDTREFRLVELILDIGRYLSVPVVAEGVETADQVALLREAGCDLVQGYYFSRPLPPEEFERLILKEKAIDRRTKE